MIFLSIIFIIGLLTSYTDLKNKKIYNLHLIIGAVLGLIITIYAAIFNHEDVLFHIINGLMALLVGLLLHQTSLWRGGDAKLFTLYAFLMPIPIYNHIIFPSVINLFACSFIAGTVLLIPAFIKDITTHSNAIANELFLPKKRQALFLAIGAIIYFSWVLFPFYFLARITNPVIILTIMYLIFNWAYTDKKEVKKHYILEFLKKNLVIISIGIIFGFLMRFYLSPNSLSYPALTKYILGITLSATLSTCIHTTFNHFKDYNERVPFAPLLFVGCLLSYTPFVTTLIQMMSKWNNLFYQ